MSKHWDYEDDHDWDDDIDYAAIVSMLSCPMRSARNAISLQRSKKLFANLCWNE